MHRFLLLVLIACTNASPPERSVHFTQQTADTLQPLVFKTNTWQYFLQHLPVCTGPVLDYRGKAVPYQQKHAMLINYDVGTRDLQQCADALMRLRAEYLFSRHRYDAIGFHFVDGSFYSWNDYRRGLRPVEKGNSVMMAANGKKDDTTHTSLRRYLDIVYNFASTISLAKELMPCSGFEVGAIIIHAGSPGHCFIITDAARNKEGKMFYKLVEGYTPAQSIYMLKNLNDESLGAWHHLNSGTIETASYRFTHYEIKKFE